MIKITITICPHNLRLQSGQERNGGTFRGQTLAEGFQEQWFVGDCILKVCKVQFAILIVVELLQCDLYQILHTLVWVLVLRLFDETVAEQGKHLVLGDESVTVQVVHSETKGHFLLLTATKESVPGNYLW